MKNILPLIAGCAAVALTSATVVYTLGTGTQQTVDQQPQTEVNTLVDVFDHSTAQIAECETDDCVLDSIDEALENLDRIEEKAQAEFDRIGQELEENMNEVDELLNRNPIERLENAMTQCLKEQQVLENMDGTTPRHEVEVARANWNACLNEADTFQF